MDYRTQSSCGCLINKNTLQPNTIVNRCEVCTHDKSKYLPCEKLNGSWEILICYNSQNHNNYREFPTGKMLCCQVTGKNATTGKTHLVENR